jgi:hypothetical protein
MFKTTPQSWKLGQRVPSAYPEGQGSVSCSQIAHLRRALLIGGESFTLIMISCPLPSVNHLKFVVHTTENGKR